MKLQTTLKWLRSIALVLAFILSGYGGAAMHATAYHSSAEASGIHLASSGIQVGERSS